MRSRILRFTFISLFISFGEENLRLDTYVCGVKLDWRLRLNLYHLTFIYLIGMISMLHAIVSMVFNRK